MLPRMGALSTVEDAPLLRAKTDAVIRLAVSAITPLPAGTQDAQSEAGADEAQSPRVIAMSSAPSSTPCSPASFLYHSQGH